MATHEYWPLRFELMAVVLPAMAATALHASLALVVGSRLYKRRRRLRARLDDAGTAALEFAVAFPFFLMAVLMTVQSALLLNAYVVVDYAAFCAARSAAVWVPTDLSGEAAYALGGTDATTSEKLRRVHTAAVLAVLPISPRATTFRFGLIPRRASGPAHPDAVRELASAVSRTQQAGVAYGR